MVFTYGKLKYNYDLITQERKTLSLTVRPDMSITVKCPAQAEQRHVDAFMKRKWRWLDVQLNFFARFNKKHYSKEYISGESFLYLGKQYQLFVREAKQDSVKLARGKILVHTTKSAYNKNYTKQLLEEWYQKRTAVVFSKRYAEMLNKFDFSYEPKLFIRLMHKRWGSFVSKKKIILNPVLIHTATDCIDYVITHELCHIQYKNHGKKFWELLDAKYPEWEKIKEKLEMRFI